MRYPSSFVVVMTLGLVGCSETAGNTGPGGVGGPAGLGGEGGARVQCIEWQPGDERCTSGEIDPIEPCCVLPSPPVQANACDGSESVRNPDSCSGVGTVVTYLFTRLEVYADCNAGFDLDLCDGATCMRGGLTAAEGLDGVDNGLAGLAPIIAGVGGNLGPIDQAFSDAFCGKTDLLRDAEGCETQITKLEWRLEVESNRSESCANVTFSSGDAALGSVVMNLSEDGCLSGQLPSIPVEIGGTLGRFANVTLRTTISRAGFSDGVMGVTHDADLTIAMSEAFLASRPKSSIDFDELFDINEDLSTDDNSGCTAMSGTYQVGGVAE